MNGKTGGNQRPRLARAMAVAVAVAMLATACGGSPSSPAGSATAGSATDRAELAFAQCMRAHGVPSFPIPSPAGNSRVSGHVTANPDSPAARAHVACAHLLPRERTAVRRRSRPAWRRGGSLPVRRRGVTHPGSSWSPTASSRCLIAGLAAAASRWCCPRRQKRGRRGPSRPPASCSRLPISGRTWRASTAGSGCPRHGSRSTRPPWPARPPRRGWPAWRRWRTPSWCTRSPRTLPSLSFLSTRRT